LKKTYLIVYQKNYRKILNPKFHKGFNCNLLGFGFNLINDKNNFNK